LRSCMAFFTSFCDFLLYLAIWTPFTSTIAATDNGYLHYRPESEGCLNDG
jgi:hypothetical protein